VATGRVARREAAGPGLIREDRVRSRIVVVAVAAALSTVPVAIAAATPSTAPVATVACTKAKIGGKTKCIARGQFCARAYKRDYERYGLHCTKRDANGRYHLQ
jgi:hypothetical protein